MQGFIIKRLPIKIKLYPPERQGVSKTEQHVSTLFGPLPPLIMLHSDVQACMFYSVKLLLNIETHDLSRFISDLVALDLLKFFVTPPWLLRKNRKIFCALTCFNPKSANPRLSQKKTDDFENYHTKELCQIILVGPTVCGAIVWDDDVLLMISF